MGERLMQCREKAVGYVWTMQEKWKCTEENSWVFSCQREEILAEQDKQLSELHQLHHLCWLIMKTTHHLRKPLLLRRTKCLHPRGML